MIEVWDAREQLQFDADQGFDRSYLHLLRWHDTLVIHPLAALRQRWDFLIMLLSMYTIIFYPFRFAFYWDESVTASGISKYTVNFTECPFFCFFLHESYVNTFQYSRNKGQLSKMDIIPHYALSTLQIWETTMDSIFMLDVLMNLNTGFIRLNDQASSYTDTCNDSYKSSKP